MNKNLKSLIFVAISGFFVLSTGLLSKFISKDVVYIFGTIANADTPIISSTNSTGDTGSTGSTGDTGSTSSTASTGSTDASSPNCSSSGQNGNS